MYKEDQSPPQPRTLILPLFALILETNEHSTITNEVISGLEWVILWLDD